jgi:hypothetical protein
LKISRILQFTAKSGDDPDIYASLDVGYLQKLMSDKFAEKLGVIYQEPIPEFESTIALQIYNDTIQYNLLSREKAHMSDALWALPMAVSALTLDEFLWLYTAFMTEHHIVFVGENQSLLTACVIALLAIVKPLRWPSPVVCLLPQSLTDLLSSPVPILVGLPCSMLYFHQNRIQEQFEHCIFVLLDEPKMAPPPGAKPNTAPNPGKKAKVVDKLQFSQRILVAPYMMSEIECPFFGGMRQKLMPLYQELNEMLNKKVNLEAMSRRMLLEPMTIKILDLFLDNIKTKLLNHVPAAPIFLDAHQIVSSLRGNG